MELDIEEASSGLAGLLTKAMTGEDIVITVAGHPMVRLVRIEHARPILGAATGQFVLPEGWDAPLADDAMEQLFGS